MHWRKPLRFESFRIAVMLLSSRIEMNTQAMEHDLQKNVRSSVP